MISFEPTPDQRDMQLLARRFANDIRKTCAERERGQDPKQLYPWDLVERASKLGFRTLRLPVEHGGIGADLLTLGIIGEELMVGDLGFGASLGTTWSYTPFLLKLPPELQREHIPAFAADHRFMLAGGVTEPDAGSDNILPFDSPEAGVRTAARRQGDYWVINGQKRFVSNGTIAKLYLLMARTDFTQGISNGLTGFALPAGVPGFTYGRVEDKIGQRLGVQGELFLDDVRLPLSHQLGEIGQGLRLFGDVMKGSLPRVGIWSIAAARSSFEAAVEYARVRVQGGKPIIQHQAIAAILADMLANIEVARSATWHALWNLDYGDPVDPKLALVAKLFAAEMGIRVTAKGCEIFGGSGIMRDFPVEKYYRDALTPLHVNSSQVIAIKVGKLLEGAAAAELVSVGGGD